MYILCARDYEGKPYVWLSKTLSVDWPSFEQGDGPFARAVRRLGKDKFHVYLLEEVDDVYGDEYLSDCLGIWVAKTRANVIGYNIAELNERAIFAEKRGWREQIHSEESIAKIKESHRKRREEKGEWREYHPASEEGRKRIIASVKGKALPAKDYILTDPNGVQHKVTNLKKFALEHGLNVGHLSSVAGGKRKHHRGWTAIKVEEKKDESKDLAK